MLLCVAVLVVSPLVGQAGQTITSTEILIQLTVHPMPAPKPAMRYLLLPDLAELRAGNPIQGYMVCMLEQQSLMEGDAAVRREKLLALPLNEFPAKELEDYGGPTLHLADRAARMEKADWQILPKLKTEGIRLLLPDVQQMRQLAQLLQVRFRSEVALHRFDAGVRTAKTMFALSRHMAEHPTLIGELVGIAIAFVAISPLEEMLEQPGCPNLYWALTNLPQPMISMEPGMAGERIIILAELPGLDDTKAMTREQLRKLIANLEDLRILEPGLTGEHKTVRAYLDARLKEKDALAAARRRLVEVGLREERLLELPADQVLLLDEKREYEAYRDEMMKLMGLPLWEAEATWKKLAPPRPWLLVRLAGPGLIKVRRAQGRLEQRIALLRHVEALRLYAAEHAGKLPEKLADCPVPLPVDPGTGKPFRYQLEGGTAHLRGTPPPGEEKNPGFNVHYEITLAK
jgi:hypothetical protein